jgi:hypothetical protein
MTMSVLRIHIKELFEAPPEAVAKGRPLAMSPFQQGRNKNSNRQDARFLFPPPLGTHANLASCLAQVRDSPPTKATRTHLSLTTKPHFDEMGKLVQSAPTSRFVTSDPKPPSQVNNNLLTLFHSCRDFSSNLNYNQFMKRRKTTY